MSLKGRALRLLAQREHSRAELERKLQAYEQNQGELAQILDQLQSKDLINEQRVAESLVYRRATKLGTARIKQELLEKGLSTDLVNDQVALLLASEASRAQEVWKRKFGSVALSPKEQSKQIRFLLGRGFSAETVRFVLKSNQ